MPRLVVEFTKMNGAGNDFIVIDNRFYHFTDSDLSGIARRFCPRRFGIGADGLLALSDPIGAADFRMRYLNADGSVGTMCGNGARCIALFAYRAGFSRLTLNFETDAGLHQAVVDPEAERVRISMATPREFRTGLRTGEGLPEASFVWTGTEHAVVFVDDVSAADVARLGPALRHSDVFDPTGANVNFVECGSGEHMRVRTFEKGVEAETLACGTGAIASVVTSYLTGRSNQTRASVLVPGGELEVSFTPAGEGVEGVTLTGPAEFVYRGTFEL